MVFVNVIVIGHISDIQCTFNRLPKIRCATFYTKENVYFQNNLDALLKKGEVFQGEKNCPGGILQLGEGVWFDSGRRN